MVSHDLQFVFFLDIKTLTETYIDKSQMQFIFTLLLKCIAFSLPPLIKSTCLSIQVTTEKYANFK